MKDKILNIIKENLYIFIVGVVALFGFVVILMTFLLTIPNFDWEYKVYQRGSRNNRLLDGQVVHFERTNFKPIAVIMENHVDSRPIAGLDKASIVYEVIVEGDITRFFAIFDGGLNTNKIGPIRSVRPFFVEIAEEWNPILFHAGGSASGLYKLSYSKIYNVNEISSDGIYFWRDAKRDAPHNLFISSDQMNRALLAKGIDSQEGDFSAWLFKEDQPIGETPASSNFVVNFSGNPYYDVEYKYNLDTNDYTRMINSSTHKTDKGIVLKANNIVIQYVDAKIIDSYGRLSIDLEGRGKAVIYQDGRKIVGTWEKKQDRTRFYDANSNEIRFNKGKIWVELVFN